MRWICSWVGLSWVERLSTSALFPSLAIDPVAELQLTAITNRRSHRHQIPESLSESRKLPTRFAEDPFLRASTSAARFSLVSLSRFCCRHFDRRQFRGARDSEQYPIRFPALEG